MPENPTTPKPEATEADAATAAAAAAIAAAAKADPEPEPAAGGDSDKQLILIAEDDPFISRMYQIKLEGAGFRVIVKNNGRDAFEAIKANHPALAVLDINMPELTGLEVLSALQGDNFDFSSMPVVVLTNSSDIKDRNAAHSYGAEYLVKAELTPRQVLDVIGDKLGVKMARPTKDD